MYTFCVYKWAECGQIPEFYQGVQHRIFDTQVPMEFVGEADLLDLLNTALKAVEAPEDQFEWLGLS